jgi:glycerate dehydrogenase
MAAKPSAAFLDYATLGPGVDTGRLEELVDATYYDCSSPSEVAARVADCDIAILNKARLGADAIRGAKRLKLIALAATGCDNVDVVAARERGIAVANIRDYCSTAVVQHVFALVLGLTQQIAGYHALVRAGAWQKSRTFAMFDYPIRELTGRVLGLCGYGSLGQSVGHVGECLGMRVIVSARPGTPRAEVPPERVHFDDVIEQSDVLSLHCPLTPATRNMIGAPQLKRMKRDAILINTARGGLIDGAALVAALRAGEIAGAGIDVLSHEPPRQDDPLLAADVPNLIVTPHIAWAARESRQRALDQVTENVADFLHGGRLRRLV